MKKLFAKILILLALVPCLLNNVRAAQLEDATINEFILASFDNIVDVALHTQGDDQNQQVVLGLKKRVDLVAASRFILGRHWRQVTPPVRDQFVQVVSNYLVDFFHHYFSLVFDVTNEKVIIKRILRYPDPTSFTVLSEVKGMRVEWQLKATPSGQLLVRDVVVQDFSILFALSNEVRGDIRKAGSLFTLIAAKNSSAAAQLDTK